MKKWMAFIGAAALVVASCGGDDESESTASPIATEVATSDATDTTAAANPDSGDGIVEVPGDHPTIQAAVDAAAEGDLVLIAPGTYNEAVDITTDNITIRGLDRNETVLDGEFALENGIRILGASGVAVENLTTINYTKNGVFWTGSTGYRASYVTTYRTGDYGIYAFDSVDGLIEHTYTAGSPDAGIYIGQCFPCNAVIRNAVSEHNGLGYSGTNSGGNLVIMDSIFRNNRAGIVPNSGSYELCYPERDTTIVGNVVHSNNQPDTPAIDVAILAMGNGILVAGGVQNTITRNLVYDHDKTGIGLVPFLEEGASDDQPSQDEWDRPCEDTKNDPVPEDVPDTVLWDSQQNMVMENEVSDSRVADIAVASLGDISTLGNCFSGNTHTVSAPLSLETLAPCDGTGDGGDWDAGAIAIAQWLVDAETAPPAVPYQEAKLPALEPQEQMPDAATAPASPAVNMPPVIDVDAVVLPTK
jgi:hypothetical protein